MSRAFVPPVEELTARIRDLERDLEKANEIANERGEELASVERVLANATARGRDLADAVRDFNRGIINATELLDVVERPRTRSKP